MTRANGDKRRRQVCGWRNAKQRRDWARHQKCSSWADEDCCRSGCKKRYTRTWYRGGLVQPRSEQSRGEPGAATAQWGVDDGSGRARKSRWLRLILASGRRTISHRNTQGRLYLGRFEPLCLARVLTPLPLVELRPQPSSSSHITPPGTKPRHQRPYDTSSDRTTRIRAPD